jgi:hypothetical protein
MATISVDTLKRSPYLGYRQGTTATFYALDDLGNPIRPLGQIGEISTDLIPFDMIDAETSPTSYTVTQNPLQDLTDATTNNYRNPSRLSLTGTWSSIETIGSIATGGALPFSNERRRDLLRLDQLKAMAEQRRPIMVATPRTVLPTAFIESITDDWTPDLSENTVVRVELIEARIVTPLTSNAVLPDVAASATGNNVPSSAGNQSGAPIETMDVRPPEAFGAAPSFIVREPPPL